MKKIIGVILIIGGILFASLAVKALMAAPQTYEKIMAAETIVDGGVIPENEGKLVVVSGTLKPAEQLKDPITGVKLPGVTQKERFGLMNGIQTAMMKQCGTGSLRVPTTAKRQISESMPKYLQQLCSPHLPYSVSLRWKAGCSIPL